nr:MAG: hypothetical protein [Chemarfal virus 155]
MLIIAQENQNDRMPLTLAANARTVVDTLSKLAKTIALPNEYPATRLPTQNAIERTAVTQFQTTGTFATSTVNGGVLHALLMRHPVTPLWLSTTFTTSGVEWSNTTQDAATVNVIGAKIFDSVPLTDATFFGTGIPAAGTAPAYNIPAAIDTETGGQYFYVPTGALCYVTFGSSSVQASGAIDFDLMKWASPGQESFALHTTATFVAADFARVIFTAGSTGWFRVTNATVKTVIPSPGTIQVACGWFTGGTYTVPTGSVNCLWPAPMLDEFVTTVAPFQNTRVTAAGLLLTNVTKVLNKEGTVLAARLTPAQSPFDPANAALGSRNVMEKYFGPLEMGCYTFTSPTPESMTFTDATYGASSNFPQIDLQNLGMCNLVRLVDTTTADTSTIAFTVDWHVEFRTTSVLFPLSVTATPLEEYQAAQVALAMMGNFFENPVHLPMIAALAGTAAKQVASALGPVLLDRAAKAISAPRRPKVSMEMNTVRSRPQVPVKAKGGKKGGSSKQMP